ncbi:MAG: c-type cytochrome [Betaproteobacteria bacterium]|nr:c-type cytochrome [Betaproteobacteria bacterium]
MAGFSREMILPRGIGVACVVATLSACTETSSPGDDPRADPRNAATVLLGEKLYQQHCAACHGAKLEGQPNWRERLPNGKLPARPHDESGHTWHHPDEVLFAITRNGVVWPHAPKKAVARLDWTEKGVSLSVELRCRVFQGRVCGVFHARSARRRGRPEFHATRPA